MLGIGKNMGIALISITVIFAGLSFTIAQDVEETPVSDSGLVTGHMILRVIDENGYVKDYRQSDNQIVQNGFNILVRETFGGTFTGTIPTSTGPVSHMGIGDNDTPTVALASTNTGLGSPITDNTCARDLFDSVFSNTATTSNLLATIDVKVTSTFLGSDCATANPIVEAGVFNAGGAGAGEMFARNTFTGVSTLGADDTLVIDWTFTFTDK